MEVVRRHIEAFVGRDAAEALAWLDPGVAFLAAVAAVVVIVYHLINAPEEDLIAGTIIIQIGARLALVAALVMVVAAAYELRERRVT